MAEIPPVLLWGWLAWLGMGIIVLALHRKVAKYIVRLTERLEELERARETEQDLERIESTR